VKKIKLSAYLNRKRTQAGLTQSEVAATLGYSTPQFISNWERGVSSPPVETIKKLAKIYKSSPEELFEIFLRESLEQAEINLTKQFHGDEKEKKSRHL
jgi:transcriptional regulator with XRE-family HTH domain